ncbi:serine hydrolase [Legionella cardiaca]|uniref:Serine hydrolase n=1 Tax=Legionella cardiaca TaxID=1071983 RepID=A0ABY8APM0_9GAMM|nr:serine hydrolase [Legionella cardiaca]WED42488.1 serine hydrolase [Legionella cardiaca]
MFKKAITSFLFAIPFLTNASPECQLLSEKNIKTLPIEKIKNYVQTAIFEQHVAPGVLLGIISGEEEAVISCGETAKGNNKRPQMDTVWPIGSVSKVFTTQMLVEMVNQGQVRLNTSIDELLENGKKSDNPITLLDLATHSAGFPRMLPTLPENNDYQVNIPYEMPEFVKWYDSYTPEYKPGTHYQYSNLGFGLLGQLLAKKRGTDFAGLLQQLIAAPLNLKDTTVKPSPEQIKREVASYWINDDLIKKDWEFRFEQPSGGLYSTMPDMLKFTAYQLSQDSRIKETTTLAHASYIYQAEFDNSLEFGDDAMALGWHVSFPAKGLPLQLVKNGWVDGVTTHVQITPTKNIGLISMTNKPYLSIINDLRNITGIIIAAQEQTKLNKL